MIIKEVTKEKNISQYEMERLKANPMHFSQMFDTILGGVDDIIRVDWSVILNQSIADESGDFFRIQSLSIKWEGLQGIQINEKYWNNLSEFLNNSDTQTQHILLNNLAQHTIEYIKTILGKYDCCVSMVFLPEIIIDLERYGINDKSSMDPKLRHVFLSLLNMFLHDAYVKAGFKVKVMPERSGFEINPQIKSYT